MQNFNYYIPTKILFGKGKTEEIGNEIPSNAKILVTYGGGSITKNGIYEEVISALKGFEILEFGGIMENPDSELIQEAIELAKNEKVDFLLAVGGGSVIDATKLIAAGYYYDGPALKQKLPIEKALPLGAVLTLPATSSEMNYISVISNRKTKEKYSYRNDLLYPKFSVIDPTHAYSLSKQQLAFGICDAFMHVMEQYINTSEQALLQDSVAESLLTILLQEGPKAVELDEPDYNNRSNLAWAQAWCLNGMIQAGVPTDLATHKVGHELTALYQITHAPSLIVTYPSVLRMAKKLRKKKMLQYARKVWNITNADAQKSMDLAIEKTVDFFNQMGISHKLADHNIPLEAVEIVANRFIDRGWHKIGNMQDVDVLEWKAQMLTDQKE